MPQIHWHASAFFGIYIISVQRSHSAKPYLAMVFGIMRHIFVFAIAALAASSVYAQVITPAPPSPSPAPIVFQSGVGTGSPGTVQNGPVAMAPPLRPSISCTALPEARTRTVARFYPATPATRTLAKSLYDKALESYLANHCRFGASTASGPGIIIIVDYAKHSGQPRLYRVDLSNGNGLDTPILVAHGVGSDPDDDGFADRFSNTPDSLASSLGAARGAEIYSGQNGRSLRLDGLEPSNNMMRYRDIVVHSYAPERRRYFNASHIARRGGRPGISEGCLVIEPDKRDLVLETLAFGGFLYAGYSGTLRDFTPKPLPSNANISFVPGKGPAAVTAQSVPAASLPQPAARPVSGTSGGTGGSQPTAPISPSPAAQRR